MSSLSNCPSTAPIILLVGYEFPVASVIFGVELSSYFSLVIVVIPILTALDKVILTIFTSSFILRYHLVNIHLLI